LYLYTRFLAVYVNIDLWQQKFFFKFQIGKYDRPYLGLFSEKITSKIKLASEKIAFGNTLMAGIEKSLGGGGGDLTEIRMK
jgi:hypothetical protein